MFEFIKEILLVLGRIITILPLLLFITLFMGKRVIGKLSHQGIIDIKDVFLLQ
jgi:uncharacterized membrane protein YcaP (DUF421 family)